LEDSAKTRRQNGQRGSDFRSNQLHNAHADYERLGTGQRTTKVWHSAGDQLITPSGFGTTP
jgi:hypothetical protein